MEKQLMSQEEIHEKVPRTFLFAAAGLVALTLGLIGTAQLTGLGESRVPEQEAIAMRDLRFEDRPSGAVAVFSVPGERLVTEMQPGTNGFVRGILRALVRERRQRGIGDDVPFRLIRSADDSLMLSDLATGRRIPLGAFGPTNSGAFASLLVTESKQP
jgi:putative photosynthetic complex assembly protein